MFSFFRITYFYVMSMLPTGGSAPHECLVLPEEGFVPLGLELSVVMNHHVGAQNCLNAGIIGVYPDTQLWEEC